MVVKDSASTEGYTDVFRKLAFDSIARLATPIKDAVQIAAIPRYFDIEILAVTMEINAEEALSLYKQLVELAFVQPYGEQAYSVYDFVRTLIIQEWLQPDRQLLYAEYNRKLAEYFHKMSDLRIHDSRTLRAEAIYHQIAIDKDVGFLWFEREFLQALILSQYSHCSYLIEIIEQRMGELSKAKRLWIDFYSGVLAENIQNWKSAEEKYMHLGIQDEWAPELRAYVMNKLIEVARNAKNPIDRSSEDKKITSEISSYKNMSQNFISERLNGRINQIAERNAKRTVIFYLCLLVIMWIGLGILLFLSNWNNIEPWVWYTGVGFTIASIAYFVITNRELSPHAIYRQMISSNTKKLFQELGLEQKQVSDL